jgi:hypothetical protein
MNEFLRRIVKFAQARQAAGPPREIISYGDRKHHRDDRPGRYAVTGPFIKLPDAEETNRSSERD